jgi:hypothetical protein
MRERQRYPEEARALRGQKPLVRQNDPRLRDAMSPSKIREQKSLLRARLFQLEGGTKAKANDYMQAEKNLDNKFGKGHDMVGFVMDEVREAWKSNDSPEQFRKAAKDILKQHGVKWGE